jgi:hypothetical protein
MTEPTEPTPEITEADFDAIHQLFARYSQTLDLGDADGFAACFTEDGILDTTAPEPELNGVHQGHDALRQYAAASVEYTAGRNRQSALNTHIEGDHHAAKATSYAIVTRTYPDATKPHLKPSPINYATLQTTGLYLDELRNEEGGWLIAKRQFRHDGLPDALDRIRKPLSAGPR